MNIIFLGTPTFAVPSLDILFLNGYTISAVITAPDKPAGRGLQIKQSPVKTYADEKRIKTLQPVKLSDPNFLEEVKALKPDLMIVVAFRMMPEALWNLPKHGTFNLHGSLLPQYRGAAPINRAIMNGEKETGLTTFFLQHAVDTGNVIFREKLAISPDEIAGELHDRMMLIGAQLVLKTVKAIESDTVVNTNQSELVTEGEELKPAPKIFADDCRINWNMSASTVHNQIRGLSPFPGAFTYLSDIAGNKVHLKIFRSGITDLNSKGETGSIFIENGNLFIQCIDKPVEILELQQEGKKKMIASDFVKGFRAEKGWQAL